MTTTHTPEQFETALTAFVAAAQQVICDHIAKNHPTLTPDVLTCERGKRYVKVVAQRPGGIGRQVHCFVDMTNGDVLKAESWRKPAKHARGNIFAPDAGAGCMGLYGAAFMR